MVYKLGNDNLIKHRLWAGISIICCINYLPICCELMNIGVNACHKDLYWVFV